MYHQPDATRRRNANASIAIVLAACIYFAMLIASR
jgi:hypothetical protein